MNAFLVFLILQVEFWAPANITNDCVQVQSYSHPENVENQSSLIMLASSNSMLFAIGGVNAFNQPCRVKTSMNMHHTSVLRGSFQTKCATSSVSLVLSWVHHPVPLTVSAFVPFS